MIIQGKKNSITIEFANMQIIMASEYTLPFYMKMQINFGVKESALTLLNENNCVVYSLFDTCHSCLPIVKDEILKTTRIGWDRSQECF